MAEVERSIVVGVPVSTAYNQWTQFEDFPRFMEGVKEVRQLDDSRLRWRASVGGRDEEWEAVITQQVPDERIGWRSVDGAPNAGNVRFEPADGGTRVTLHMLYEPRGVVEAAGDLVGFVERRVDGDLARFKEFVESRGSETGAWRGTIHNPAPQGTRNPER
jgi:uncharacterized membrane protein